MIFYNTAVNPLMIITSTNVTTLALIQSQLLHKDLNTTSTSMKRHMLKLLFVTISIGFLN